MVARVIESAVLVCMSTYVYSFGPNLYLQCTGGPIGMRFTASLANVVMKHWDKAWVSLLKRENIKFDMFLRYVDDCRLFLPALNSGWVWSGTSFAYSKEQAEADNTDGTTYVQRTIREMIKAMCSLTDFLRFTGEDCSMFCENNLPTLDTAIWLEKGKVMHKFFEKPTVGNRVLDRNTALPVASLRASLLQEAVRRLQNCSEDLPIATKQDILSKYGAKLINSGHSLKSARILIVQGVVKFIHRLDMSKLPKTDPRYKPLHLSKEYCEDDRQILKYRAKMEWFKSEKKDKNAGEDQLPVSSCGWRSSLRGVWKGASSSQRPVLQRGFSTVVNIPNTCGASLTQKLIKCETKLAKLTKYNVKVVEMSGMQLIRLFQRVHSPKSCHWSYCPVCK